ncbi:MAG TPA: aspartate aminotransferase family protein [Candidatus Anaerostipes excrementavium]|uniref:Acetylornithine aminotransferase n=1 Tax=Candidatus Anaerostipes excrementavium TaxID=2838463 RepID=A0A9D2B8G9_9FIRM|nr:aspartate aminotransferase family protein [uncultured Anaerostipes sp.]HIX67180.1 aspartate aminotransferase family protein [Candidatus Anaerostipes excrementavium]
MKQEEYIQQGEKYILKTYNRYPVVLEKGEGVYLYDAEQKKYLDFGAGIAVFALGYGNKAYNDALKEQVDQLIHTSNLYYNIPAVEAAEKIVKASGMKRVFFSNSGTEAIEGALKVARKYAYNKDDSKDYEFIAMDHSFHGRSQGALSVTGNAHYQDGFIPKEFRAVFAQFNDLEDVKSKITENTCGIICEVVQGEGGIYPADPEFLKGLRKLCDEKDILLIFDEIQCGMGRCGSLFAHDLYGVKPDVMTLAKALGCGVPVGAFVVNEKADGALVPGDHGTTYGGNPLACAAVNAVFDQFEEKKIPEHVEKVGQYLWDQLEILKKEFCTITAHRGLGLMQGLEFAPEKSAGEIVSLALEKGLILMTAGNNVIRFVPPLIIEEKHVDEMMKILREVLKEKDC